MKRTFKNNQRNSSGQSLVEFALALPFLLLMIVSIMYFGRVFYLKQTVSLASQEGARALRAIPGLSDSSIRQQVIGFTSDGQSVNPNSVVAKALASANLLSSQNGGSLPPGSRVLVLPWDSSGDPADSVAPGTVTVRIEYPFKFLSNPFDGSNSTNDFGDSIDVYTGSNGAPVSFGDFTISESASVMPELFQQYP